jgi:ATP-dependent RNA helicase RhlE
VHRIGRTGRAGSEGEASSLVCIDELKLLAGIEKLIKQELPLQVVAGFEVDPSIAAKPIVNGGTNGTRAQGGRNQPAAAKKPAASGAATPHPHGKAPSGARPSNKPAGRAPASTHRSGGRNH